MRCITKQNVIRGMRLKFVQIAMLQDKALATKRPEMRDGRLASKAKLKGGQIQDQVHENSASVLIALAQKRLGVLFSSSIVLTISTRV
jgi:hypothetical protein